jgi:aminoglycoside phosphotransferase family enzyme/predicted kinase
VAVEHTQTHTSHVFLTGDYAYKLKKPVDMGFLDFRTPAARRHYCLEELHLNRRLCPEIYLEVLAVVTGPEGPRLVSLQEAETGATDYCLKMTQMDRAHMMDLLLDLGAVGEYDIRALAGVLADFHTRAKTGPQVNFFGQPEQVRINVEENFRQTEDHQEVSVAPARWRAIRDWSLSFMADNWALFERRVAQSRVRDCHGDLHSGNINLPESGRPLIFDCIEFNERFRYQDTAADLALLAMDLDFHDRRGLARLLVEIYVEDEGDSDLVGLVNFYKCYRAMVRAKVYGFMFDDADVHGREKITALAKARTCFRLAAEYAGGGPSFFLVCLMGLMGTGKTFLARELAKATGWVGLHSDAVRKRLAGLDSQTRRYDAWGQGIYGKAATEATYEALCKSAEAHLAQGASVIVDSSFCEDARRHCFLELAKRYGARPLFVEVRASAKVVAAYLAARRAKGCSISDGRSGLMAVQAASWENVGPLLARHSLIVDGGAELVGKLGPLLARLKEMGHTT